MPLILTTSNRLEVLADHLADVLSTPLPSPLDPEIILVQSRGMERWVSLELARRLGVCAQIQFPFPNHFAGQVFKSFFPDSREPLFFKTERLAWRIMELLPGFLSDPAFQELARYLADDPDRIKRFQLAGRLAALYDQYLLFRPDMIWGWEQGRDGHWEARLWRKLIGTEPGKHRAALLDDLRQAAREGRGPRKPLPLRVSVFGISALPPFHIEVLSLLARHTTVQFFLLNPCREYWGDLLSRLEKKRLRRSTTSRTGTVSATSGEGGHPLLAAWGEMGREFIDLLLDQDPEERSDFRDPPSASLLGRLQGDMVHLRTGDPEQRIPLDPADDSLQVHVAHSPRREVEILQDIILDLLDRDPTLRPRDILVLMPEVQVYAAFIRAVFALPPDDPRAIPFSLADRGVRQESPLIDAYLSFLQIPHSRLEASRVLALLELEPVRNRFGLTRSDLEAVHRWVRDTGIRWASTGSYREQLGLPPLDEHTWEAGLDRMLLGYALTAEGDRTFGGLLPYETIAGGEAVLLGRFLTFTRSLFRATEELSRDRDLESWADLLSGYLETFFLPAADQQGEAGLLQRQFQELREARQSAGFSGEVGLAVITDFLQRHLEQKGTGSGFLTGGVTFCALLPMRSIPFRVICLLGMNDDAYPRPTRPLGFDLMAARPRPGDRSRRKDDRYLFLEALISGREKLIISYQGRSVQDNSPRPPSVLVNELLEAVDRSFTSRGGGPASGQIVRHHRLQAFHPAYFKDGGRLFSFSREDGEAARRLSRPSSPPAPFIPEALSEPGPEWRQVSVEQLADFFSNPSRHLLQKRLGLFLEERTDLLEETEPFELEGLELYRVQQELAELALQGRDPQACQGFFRSRGLLPQGSPGNVFFQEEYQKARAFAEAVRKVTGKGETEVQRLDRQVSDFTITGELRGKGSRGLVHYRYANMKWRDRINLWIQHLLLCREGEDPSCLSQLVCRDRQSGFHYEPAAEPCLTNLLEMYWRGLRAPLPLFPRASWAYIDASRTGKTAGKIRENVRQAWDNEFTGGDLTDPYLARCFGEREPFEQPAFEELAETVMGPLWDSEHVRS